MHRKGNEKREKGRGGREEGEGRKRKMNSGGSEKLEEKSSFSRILIILGEN